VNIQQNVKSFFFSLDIVPTVLLITDSMKQLDTMSEIEMLAKKTPDVMPLKVL
jgi:hypothetical protein